MQSIDSQITKLFLEMEFSSLESMEDFKRYARELGDGPFNPPSYYDLLHQAISLNHAIGGAINSALGTNERKELNLNKLALDTRGIILSALCEHDVTQQKKFIQKALENFPKQLQLMEEETNDEEKRRKQRLDIQIYMNMCHEILESV